MIDRKPARELRVGARLANRYTLARRLGRGGAAETWLATDRITRAAVALKILVDDRVGADALRREWQLAIRLMHAHIVRAFEFHEDDGAFYSLQFIDGPDIGVLAGAPPQESLPPVALIADAYRKQQRHSRLYGSPVAAPNAPEAQAINIHNNQLPLAA